MDNCINWQGLISGGYGVDDGHSAHRRAWEARYGPVPDGLLIHHICANTACVNVDHLVAVSKAANGRIHRHADFRRGDKSRRWRLNEADIREALRLSNGKKSHVAIRLECTRATLDNYIKDLKIDVNQYKKRLR